MLVTASHNQEYEVSEIGGKAKNLIELLRFNNSVPPFFVIPSSFLNNILTANGVQKPTITDPDEDWLSFNATVLNLEIPEDNRKEIEILLSSIGDNYAVRSSAVIEDSLSVSAAGVFRSVLGVSTETIFDAILECWASLFTAASKFTHISAKVSTPNIAIIIQQIINPDVSGVVFTADPMVGSMDSITVNATFGIGEGVMEGSSPVDFYVINRNGTVMNRTIAEKRNRLYANNGVTNDFVSDKMRNSPCLSDEELSLLVTEAIKIEEHFKVPQDIEFLFVNKQLYILQTRPITTPLSDVNILNQLLDGASKANKNAEWNWSNNIGKKPICTLAQEFWKLNAEVRQKATAELNMPRIGTWTVINGFVLVGSYQSISNINLDDDCFINKYGLAWENLWKREVEETNERIESDYLLATDEEKLLSLLLKLTEVWKRHWYIHDMSMTVKQMAIDKLIIISREKGIENNNILSLFQGYQTINKVVQNGIEALAEYLKNNDVLENEIRFFVDAPAKLSFEFTDKDFQNEFYCFINRWKHRIVGSFDLTFPNWYEDNRVLLKAILAQSNTPAQKRQDNSITENFALIEKRFAETIGEPNKILVDIAKTWALFLEEHNYLIEQSLTSFIRMISLKLGEMMTQIGLQNSEDILFVSLEEISKRIVNPKLISERKEHYKKMCCVNLPKSLAKASISPNQSNNDIFTQKYHPNPESALPQKLLGIPASPGRVRGCARVVVDIQDAKQILSGDILVCQRTTPAWTPYFSIIGGIVVNDGAGILQHSAVNAREYQIPAVIGTKSATQLIKNGQYITVDGTIGEVLLI